MSKLIDFIENREDFLKNEYLLEFFNKDIEYKQQDKNDFYIELTKVPFHYIKNRDMVYIDDVIVYKKHNNLDHLIIVDKSTKTILFNPLELTWAIKCVSCNEIRNLVNDNCFVNNLEGYKVKSLDILNEEFLNTIRAIDEELTELNKELICESGKKYLEEELNNTNYKNEILKEIELDFVLGTSSREKPKTNYSSNHYSSKFYDVFYKNKSNKLTLLTLEFLRDKDQAIKDIKEEYYKGLECFKDNSGTLNRDVYLYNYKNEVKKVYQDDFYSNKDLLNLKRIVYALKNAGKTVIINDRKYENRIQKEYDNQLKVGTYNGNGYIYAKDIKTIKFGGKLLYSA